jgi:type VI secretion system protein ImpA
MALEQASQGRPERQTGEIIVPAEEPNWLDIKQRAGALFSRTKDLRVALLLIRACTHCDSMEGLASGLNLLHGLLTRYWEDVHPGLDPEEGPVTRLNVLSSLENPATLLRDLRGVNFISTGNHSRLSVRDVLIVTGNLPAPKSDSVPAQAEIEEILGLSENAKSVQAMHDALAALNGMHSFLGETVGYDQVPDTQPLRDMLKGVLQLCKSNVSGSKTAGDMDEAMGLLDEETGSVGRRPISGEIQSREDASRMLEKICEFIERTEPANPAPLFIRRAQRLMTKSFVEIIEDLAPDSLDQIKHLTGLERDF